MLRTHARTLLGGALVALLGLAQAGCLEDAPVHREQVAWTPEALADGWQVATPAEVGLDGEALDAVVRQLREDPAFYMSRSLLVVRHGRLVLEAYLDAPEDREQLQHVKSATKSVTSLVAGIALARGDLPSLDTRLYALMPDAFDADARKQAITLEDLLLMRSGLRWRNEVETGVLKVEEPEDSLRFTLAQPLAWEPGTYFEYKDADPHLVGGAVQRATGIPFDTYADQHLFAPLGIREWRWERHRDGVPYGAFGLWLKPRDMARLGQLCLQGGAWEGRQLVPQAWLEASTRAQVNQDDGPYGYYWWVRPEYRAYAMWGHGGQFIYVLPDEDLVLVHTARPYTSEEIPLRAFEALVQRILRARVR